MKASVTVVGGAEERQMGLDSEHRALKAAQVPLDHSIWPGLLETKVALLTCAER